MITEIPLLGSVTKDAEFDLHRSDAIPVKVLGNQVCRIVVEGYEFDEAKSDFHEAVENFLNIDEYVLRKAEQHIFAYYAHCLSSFGAEDPDFPQILVAGEVWNHIQLGNEPVVSRRRYGDKGIYVSVECECDWEPEHGLGIVFKNGRSVNKVGPCDGHLANSDAYADPTLEDVVYRHFHGTRETDSE